MKILFDTSALIPLFVEKHNKHEQSKHWFTQCLKAKHKMLVAVHSIAECYAILTRLPVAPKISSNAARRMINNNIEKHAEIITLSKKDHNIIIDRLCELDLIGGIIYDAIIFQSAIKGKADKLLSFNHKDFIRLCPDQPDFILSA